MIYQLAFTGRISDFLITRDVINETCNAPTARELRGITLYCGHRVLQILEGPETIVLEHYNLIESDPRNSGINIIHEGSLEKPTFKATQFISQEVPYPDYLKSVETSLISGRLVSRFNQ